MPKSKFLPLAVAAILVALATPASADISVPGRHNQRTECHLDFGPYADYVTRVHKLERGDTLGALAQKLLGSTKRWREILDLNPGLEPEALPTGPSILIPPKAKPLAADEDVRPGGARHWWDVLTVNLPGSNLDYAQHGEQVSWGPYGCWLVAVRHDKLADFRERVAAPKVSVTELVTQLVQGGAPWIARSKGNVAGRGGTDDADPVWKLLVERRITKIADGVVGIEDLGTTYYGKDGKELSKADIEAAKSRWTVLLIALAVGAAAGLWFVLRRRRATSPSTTAA